MSDLYSKEMLAIPFRIRNVSDTLKNREANSPSYNNNGSLIVQKKNKTKTHQIT